MYKGLILRRNFTEICRKKHKASSYRLKYVNYYSDIRANKNEKTSTPAPW